MDPTQDVATPPPLRDRKLAAKQGAQRRARSIPSLSDSKLMLYEQDNNYIVLRDPSKIIIEEMKVSKREDIKEIV